jgi:NAD(P)-dependent dehydrogenase (short-subunit alcohol dehydrogenase family)
MGLYGLVNNAGILTLGPITEIDEDELAWILDVNLMGVYRVTKAFAPLIKEPDDVTDAVVHALFDESPKPNYLVVPNETEARWTISKIVEEMAELNADQKYSYTDEELIEMRKEATAAQRK